MNRIYLYGLSRLCHNCHCPSPVIHGNKNGSVDISIRVRGNKLSHWSQKFRIGTSFLYLLIILRLLFHRLCFRFLLYCLSSERSQSCYAVLAHYKNVILVAGEVALGQVCFRLFRFSCAKCHSTMLRIHIATPTRFS